MKSRLSGTSLVIFALTGKSRDRCHHRRRSSYTTANASGEIVIDFRIGTVDQPKIDAIVIE